MFLSSHKLSFRRKNEKNQKKNRPKIAYDLLRDIGVTRRTHLTQQFKNELILFFLRKKRTTILSGALKTHVRSKRQPFLI